MHRSIASFSTRLLILSLAITLAVVAGPAPAQSSAGAGTSADGASAAGSAASSETASPRPASGTANNGPSAAPERPVYLQVVPVGNARFSMLSEELVISLANEALSSARQATIRADAKTLPEGVRVLRITYIVHEQQDDSGVSVAASAATELLRTAKPGDAGPRRFVIYSGLQQSLITSESVTEARQALRAAFKEELQSRIATAFQDQAQG